MNTATYQCTIPNIASANKHHHSSYQGYACTGARIYKQSGR